MPIYEYACQSCGNRFDKLQKLSDPDPTDCPQCGRPEVKRAVTAAAFRLKGGGWYETDFKSDSDKKRNLVEGSSSAGSGDSKTESAPAKTEAAPAAPAPSPAAPAASS